jgi:hypothetical protein
MIHFTWNDHGVFVHIVRTLESFQEHVKKILGKGWKENNSTQSK